MISFRIVGFKSLAKYNIRTESTKSLNAHLLRPTELILLSELLNFSLCIPAICTFSDFHT